MKKVTYLMVLAAGVLLASCSGESVKLSPEEEAAAKAAKDGILGKTGEEIVRTSATIDALEAQRKEMMDKVFDKDAKITGEDMDKMDQKLKDAKNQWTERCKALLEEQKEQDIATELAEGTPLKLAQPFRVTTLFPSGVVLTVKLELTADRPKIRDSHRHDLNYYWLSVTPLDGNGEALSAPINLRSDVIEQLYKDLKAGEQFNAKLEFYNSYSNPDHNGTKILSAKKLLIGWEHPVQEKVPSVPGRGDLGGYDLRGPVQKCVWGQLSVTFNIEGQLETVNGQSLKRIYPGGVTRNNEGRLTECNADGYGSCYYTYNSQGLPTEIAEDGYNRKFTYDADGYVSTMEESIAPDMGDDESGPEVNKYTYTILEKDEYDNWTKRKNQSGSTETRRITYYD